MTASLADLNESVLFENAAISEPERTRSLPTRYLDLRYEDFLAEAPANFGRVCSLEKQGKRLDQVCSGLFDGPALARYIELRAQSDETVIF